MVDTRLLSRCGIYCGACIIYRAERDSSALLEDVSRQLKVPKKEIKCNGCSSPYAEQWRNCQNCGLKACQDRMGFGTCVQCPEYDVCPDYAYLAGFTAHRGEDIRGVLARVEAGESMGILDALEKRWRCPDCGEPLIWYDNNCRSCGARVKEEPIEIDGFKPENSKPLAS